MAGVIKVNFESLIKVIEYSGNKDKNKILKVS